jgi:Fe2+ or Zn2+ uptake regulation protein
MIDKNGGKYHLVCDNCGEQADEDFDDWEEAKDFKKANWSSRKEHGEWADICPKCKGAK